MSQGILTHCCFKDKDQVLFVMMRYANRVLMDAVVINLRQAETRLDGLTAIVDGNLPEKKFDRSTANAWVSFYAEAAHNPRYASWLQELFYKRLRSNIGSALSPLWSRDEIDHFVRGFAAMLDGFWLRRGHSDDISHLEARALIVEYSEKMIGLGRVSKLKRLQLQAA